MCNKIMSTIKSTDLLHHSNIKSLKALKESIEHSDYDPCQRDDDGDTALHCGGIRKFEEECDKL